MYGCELGYKESWAPKNSCSGTMVLEDSWESFGLQGDQTSQFQRKSTLIIHWKDWCWCWSSNTLTTRYKQLTHWQRPWGWERLRAGGKGGSIGCDGWMASPTQWTWAWGNREKGREAWHAAVHGSQRVRHNLVTEQQQTVFGGSQVVQVVKNLPANAGDVRDAGLILGSGETPEVRNGNLLILA